MGKQITCDAFKGQNSYGSVRVYEEFDGSIWARITINGETITKERIDNAPPSIPLDIERRWQRL